MLEKSEFLLNLFPENKNEILNDKYTNVVDNLFEIQELFNCYEKDKKTIKYRIMNKFKLIMMFLLMKSAFVSIFVLISSQYLLNLNLEQIIYPLIVSNAIFAIFMVFATTIKLNKEIVNEINDLRENINIRINNCLKKMNNHDMYERDKVFCEILKKIISRGCDDVLNISISKSALINKLPISLNYENLINYFVFSSEDEKNRNKQKLNSDLVLKLQLKEELNHIANEYRKKYEFR